MPESLPAVPGVKVVRALERAGFTVVRISGSHRVMRHPDGLTVVVPVHADRDMAKGTLRNILAIIGHGRQGVPEVAMSLGRGARGGWWILCRSDTRLRGGLPHGQRA